MKKTICYLFLAFTLLAFVQACKHDPISPNPQPGGGGTGGSGGTTGGNVSCSPDTAYFKQQVSPILISNCALSGCHDAGTRQDGVQLTDYNSIISTGDVRPGRPSDSEIWEKINETDPTERMPPMPRNPLSQEQKNIIYKWILQGAKNNSCETSVCDTSNISYSVNIKNIVAGKCQGCHSSSAASGGIDLSTYTGVKSKVTDGRLWGAVNHLAGFSPMPKGGTKLSDCELGQIKKWMDAGAPNN